MHTRRHRLGGLLAVVLLGGTVTLPAVDRPAEAPGAATGTPRPKPLKKKKPKPPIVIRRRDLWLGYSRNSGDTVPGDAWAPVHLIITNNSKKAFTGSLQMRIQDRLGVSGHRYDSLYSVPVDLFGHGSTKHIVAHVYVPQLGRDGRSVEGSSFPLSATLESPSHPFVSLPVNQRGSALEHVKSSRLRNISLIEREFVLKLTTGAQSSIPKRRPIRVWQRLIERSLVDGDLESLPRRWIAYAGFHTVIWDGVDLGKLDPLPAAAMREYVQSGGHLVLAIGENRNMLLRSALADILHCSLGAHGKRDLGKEILGVTGLPPAAVVDLEPDPGGLFLESVPDQTGRPISRWTRHPIKQPLAIRTDHGAGSITVLSFSLNSAFLRPQRETTGRLKESFQNQWPHWSDKVFSLPHYPHRALAARSMERTALSYLRTSATKRIPSRGSIAAFLILYLIVISPVTYMIFRCWRRVELAWVLTPLISIAFFAYSYGVALAYLEKSISITDLAVMRLGSDGLGGVRAVSMLHNPTYNTFGLSFGDLTVTPDHQRRPVMHNEAVENSQLLREEKSGRITVKDFDIGFDNKRPLQTQAAAHLGTGLTVSLSPKVFDPTRGHLLKQELGTASNQTGHHLTNLALIWEDKGCILEPVKPGAAIPLRALDRDGQPHVADRRSVISHLCAREAIARLAPTLELAVQTMVGLDPRPHLVGFQKAPLLSWRTQEKPTPSSGLLIYCLPCPHDEYSLNALHSLYQEGPAARLSQENHFTHELEEQEDFY